MDPRSDHWAVASKGPSKMLEAGHTEEGRIPMGMKRVRPGTTEKQTQHLVGMAAHGRVPLDDNLAGIIGRTLDREYQNMKDGKQ